MKSKQTPPKVPMPKITTKREHGGKTSYPEKRVVKETTIPSTVARMK